MLKFSAISIIAMLVAGAFCLAVIAITVMAYIPLLNSGGKVSLPETESSLARGDTDAISIKIDKDGIYYILDKAIALEQIPIRLDAMTLGDHTKPVYVRADATVAYEHVAKVMACLSQSGFVKISLLPEMSGKPATKTVTPISAEL